MTLSAFESNSKPFRWLPVYLHSIPHITGAPLVALSVRAWKHFTTFYLPLILQKLLQEKKLRTTEDFTIETFHNYPYVYVFPIVSKNITRLAKGT